MLQQVFVLQQQLVDSSLRLQSGRGLRVQLVPQKVDLQEMMRSEDRRGQSHSSQALTGLFWDYHVDAGICDAAWHLGIFALSAVVALTSRWEGRGCLFPPIDTSWRRQRHHYTFTCGNNGQRKRQRVDSRQYRFILSTFGWSPAQIRLPSEGLTPGRL